MTNTAWLTGPPLDAQQTEWLLEKDNYLIGSEPSADLVVPLSRIERQHARIIRAGRSYAICDLASRNGTFINGKPISTEPQPLRDGDQIGLGGIIALCFHDPGAAAEEQPKARSGVWVDESMQAAWVDGRRIEPPLSPAQLALLALLHRAGGQVVARPQIVAAVWPDANPDGVGGHAIDALTKRLCARLREIQPEREYLEMLRGQQLRLVPPEQ
ncbi:MAG: FHA domain-containing protein [Roseiflexaceae bacterium]